MPSALYNDEGFSPQRSQRIPVELQAVFLASNRGEEVHSPPPNSIAFRTFKTRRIWGGLLRKRTWAPVANSKKPVRRSSGLFPPPPPLSPPCSPRPPSSPKHEISPHAYLGSMTASRGYSKNEFPALKSAYFSVPTDFEKSSYGSFYLSAVREGNSRTVRRLLLAGLSPNATNAHGGSVLHTACRMGKTEVVRLLLDFGANVQVCDDSGRTPLHDACWSDKYSFEIIEMILHVDKRMLFFTDSGGEAPLSYVRREDWTAFTRLLMSTKNKYWPDRDFAMLGPEEEPQVLQLGPNSRPIPNLTSDVSLDAIADIASGIGMKRGTLAHSSGTKSLEDGLTEYSEYSYSESFEGTEYTEDGDYDDSDSDSDSDDDEDDEEASFASFDEDELNDILRSIDSRVPVQWSK